MRLTSAYLIMKHKQGRTVPPVGVWLHSAYEECAGVEARAREILIRGAKDMVVTKQLNSYIMKAGADYAICS